MTRHRSPAKWLFIVTTTALLGALSSPVEAVIVATFNRTLNGGTADFGSGSHSLGTPLGSGVVTFDYDTSTGQVVATGRVRGTVYWDALFAAYSGDREQLVRPIVNTRSA